MEYSSIVSNSSSSISPESNHHQDNDFTGNEDINIDEVSCEDEQETRQTGRGVYQNHIEKIKNKSLIDK